MECNCWDGWEAGTIVGQFYRRADPLTTALTTAPCRHRRQRAASLRRQSSFPPGSFAPYQVCLDNGKRIYAPLDEDGACRAYTDEAAPAGASLPLALALALALPPTLL